MSEWINRNLDDIGATAPCRECRTPSISVGNGYCLDCYLHKLSEILIKGYPVSGPEVIEKLKRKGLDI